MVTNKKLLSLLLVFVILLSSANAALAVSAAGHSVNLELFGGTLTDYTQGSTLPTYEQISKDGFSFAGWYANADFTGEQVFSLPAGGADGATYYAHWIVLNADSDDFDSYSATEELLGSWSDWRHPAVNSETTLNTAENRAYSGNSVKVCPNEANKSTEIVLQKNINKKGGGFSFWIESENGVKVRVLFNHIKDKSLQSPVYDIPAGRHILAIPWSDINGAAAAEYLWQLSFTVSVPNAADAVYIDSAGTYYTENKISFNTDGGVWIEGYAPPEKYIPETALPNAEKIKRDGFTLVGWRAENDTSGECYTVIPETAAGDISYRARWVVMTENYDNFESYNSGAELLNSWSDWKTPAAESDMSLNTDSDNSYSGNSVKICPNEAEKAAQITVSGSFMKNGDGIAFWIKSPHGTDVQVKFNNNTRLVSQAVNIPADRHIVTIPWSDISGAADTENLQRLALLISVPNAADAVYIDSLGTYYTENGIRFNTDGGVWTGGYTPPEKYVPETALPDCGDIKKDGFTFAGWCKSGDISGKSYYAIPADVTGDVTYCAKWITADPNGEFDDFESYGTKDELLKSWADWKWPAENSEISLNTDPSHAYGGNSLKVCPNAANKNSEIVLQRNFELTGDGVSFWIESENGATVRILFNHIKLQNGTYKSLSSPVLNIPGAKQIVAIPWTDIEGATSADYLWQLSILVSVPNAADAVYIDEVGTYTEPEYEKVHSNWGKGFSDFYDEDGKTVWSYSGSTAVGGEFVGFVTDFLTEKNKKYVIAFDYKYLTDGKLAWSLEPQSAGNIFEESLLYRQTDESRETLNSQNRNTDWQVRKTAFAAENDNKYLAFFAKTAAGAAYDISIKNIRLYDLGDVDFSGKIDASDLAALKKELLGAESAAEFTDVNNDGYWDVRDLTTLKKMLTNAEQADAEEETSNNPLRRGVNFSGFEFEEEIGFDSWIFDGKYYDIVREKGFDHIRLPVDFFPRMGASPDYTIDSEFLRKIDTLIDTALNSGLKIVLDFHHFGELQTNVKGNKQKYYKMWEQLSEHYKDYPPALVFELLNEPGNASAISGGGPDVFTPAKILEIQEEAIKIIRKTNPTRLIVHATSWNDGAAQLMSTEPLLPDDENIIMSIHSYEPLTFTHQGADWDGDGIYWPASDFTDDMKGEILDVFKLVKEYHKKYNRPVWVGEFGVFNRITPDGARAKYADFIVDVMKDADCGWCWWEFQMGFRLYSTKYDEWVDDALMAALLK